MNVTITIWWRAVILNAFIIGTGAIIQVGLPGFIIMFMLIIAGFLITLPLLPVASLLLKLQGKLPYGSEERICWLCFMLVFLVWSIYLGAVFIMTGGLPGTEPVIYLLATGTSLALLTAVWLSKNSISQLHQGNIATKESFSLQTPVYV